MHTLVLLLFIFVLKWILDFFKSFKETLVGNNKSKGRKFKREL